MYICVKTIMDNQQLYNLNALQLALSAYFGDGNISKKQNSASVMSTNESLLTFKANLINQSPSTMENKGWGNKLLYILRFSGPEVYRVKRNSLSENLSLLDNLGLALWFYDDGSLHKSKLFYNLCTHSFSKEDHEKYLIPFFEVRGFSPILRTEIKKDGRVFYYLSFNKMGGAVEVAKLLAEFPVEGMQYKLWSSETIQRWSTLQEQWKREGQEKSFKIWARGKI